MIRTAVICGLAALAVVPGTATAGPFASGADLLSASLARQEQGDDATPSVALSLDGRYAVLDTRATNFFADDDPDPPGGTRVGGIFRRDLATGALDEVADGDVVAEADGSVVLRGAHNPSISGDGRFVVFSTAQKLVAADTNDNLDVYRRDMALASGAPGAFVLISARDGGDAPARYAARDEPLAGRNPGTDVFAGRAISADGDRVAFRTVEVASDLPDRPAVDTPGGQVLVRDVSARTTRLLTRRTSDGGPAGGATGPVTLSADGSTVVWVGANAPEQTRFLPAEQRDQVADFYLYRRLDGPGQPTRRITGTSDPDDPACGGGSAPYDPLATGPCYGPLTDTEEGRSDISQRAVGLSGDGYTVVFLASGGLRPSATADPGLDLFVTDMRPGVSRKAGTRELTREGAPSDPAASPPMETVALAADGRHAFVTTLRSRFVLPALAPVGSFPPQPGGRELYAVDLAASTIERVVRGLQGAEPAGDVANNPSPAADGALVAFVSGAANLFFGDANDRSDAFAVRRLPDAVTQAPPAPPVRVTQSFESPAESTGPRLSVKVRRRSDGTLRVSVGVPAAGTLVAFARAGSPLRTVARATVRAKRKGTAVATLRLRGADARRLRRTGRLSSSVRIRFAPTDASQLALTRVVSGRFARTVRKPAKRRSSSRK